MLRQPTCTENYEGNRKLPILNGAIQLLKWYDDRFNLLMSPERLMKDEKFNPNLTVCGTVLPFMNIKFLGKFCSN